MGGSLVKSHAADDGISTSYTNANMTPVEKLSLSLALLVMVFAAAEAGTFRRRREISNHEYNLPSLANTPTESLRSQADELTNHTAAVIDLVLQNVHRLKNYEERARLERLVTRFKNLVDELQHPHHSTDNQRDERRLVGQNDEDSVNDQNESESLSARAAIRAQAEQLRFLQKKNHFGAGPVHSLLKKNITDDATQPTLNGATDSSILPLSATEVTEPAPSEPSLTQESTEDDSEADELVMELRQEVPQGDTPEDNTYREVPAAENEVQPKTQFAEALPQNQQNQLDIYPEQSIKTEAEQITNQERETGSAPSEIGQSVVGSEIRNGAETDITPMRIPWLPRQPIPGEILKPGQRSLISPVPPQELDQTDSVGSSSHLQLSNQKYKPDQYFASQPERTPLLAVPIDEVGIASDGNGALEHPAPIVMSMDPASRQLDTDVTLLRAVINNLHQMQEVLKRMREAEVSRSR